MAEFPWTDAEEAAGNAGNQLAVAFTRAFATDAGQQVLAHLRAITVERALPPDTHDAALRHIEGQRHLVKYMETLIERGKE